MLLKNWGVSGEVYLLITSNQILGTCTKVRDIERPSQEWRCACGRPSTTWIHQVCHNMGVTATEALQLAEDRPFWWTIATARMLHVMMMTMIYLLRN